jgi:hypothetical protein
METLLLYIINHWSFIVAAFAAAGSALVHGYQIIVNAGGLVNIFKKFLYGQTEFPLPSPTPIVNPQPVIPVTPVTPSIEPPKV